MADSPHNPYAPPKAPVAESGSSIPRPEAVDTAMKLLWTSFGLTFAEVALDWEGQAAEGIGVFLIFLVIGIAITVWLLLKVRVGRNWARITYLVLTAVSIPPLLMGLPDLASRAPIAAVLTLIDLILVFYALYLLFFPGREWFRSRAG